MLTALLMRLRDLVDIVHDVRALRDQVAAGNPELPALALPRGIAPDATRFRDHGMALLSGISAALTVGVVCAFWIGTAWPQGGVAAMLAAVGCSFFAAQDDPGARDPAIPPPTLISVAIGAVYLFVILPMVAAFEVLTLVFAPIFLVLGVLIAMPATNFPRHGHCRERRQPAYAFRCLQCRFHHLREQRYRHVVGMGAAADAYPHRPLGRRRLECTASDARQPPGHRPRRPHRDALDQATLDRADPRPAVRTGAAPRRIGAACRQGHADALIDLRTGLNVVHLQRDSADLPAERAPRSTARSMSIAGYFRERAPRAPDDALRGDIDRAIVAVTSASGPRTGNLLLELVGIRHNLFPDAPPYHTGPGIVQRGVQPGRRHDQRSDVYGISSRRCCCGSARPC